MNKKEKSAWAIFFTTIALPFVFVSLLSLKGCGSNSGGSGGSHQGSSGGSHQGGSGWSHQDETCVEKDDCFRNPEALSLVSTFNDAKSNMAKSTARDGIWNFILEGARSLNPEHDSIIEQLETKSPPKSLIGVYKRAVPLLVVGLEKTVNVTPNKTIHIPNNMAVAGASIKEGVFREASKEEEKKYKKLSPDFSISSVVPWFPNIIPDFSNINSQEYKKYRLIEDHNFESAGSLSPRSNGYIFYIEKLPTINLWFETEKEKNLALKGGQLASDYRFYGMPVLRKKSDLLKFDSPEKHVATDERQRKRLDLETFGGKMRKIGDVIPKKGSNLRELWVYSFAVKARTEKIPLAGSFYLVKIHVG